MKSKNTKKNKDKNSEKSCCLIEKSNQEAIEIEIKEKKDDLIIGMECIALQSFIQILLAIITIIYASVQKSSNKIFQYYIIFNVLVINFEILEIILTTVSIFNLCYSILNSNFIFWYSQYSVYIFKLFMIFIGHFIFGSYFFYNLESIVVDLSKISPLIFCATLSLTASIEICFMITIIATLMSKYYLYFIFILRNKKTT